MKENQYLKWLSSETRSIYWHDSAVQEEQIQAFLNRATGMTTNPFLINAPLRSGGGIWNDGLSEIPRDLKGDEKAEARMIMSIAPRIASLLENVTDFEERITRPVPQERTERLLTVSEFRRAYEPDGMKPEDFITFGPTNRTTTQFINEGWNPLESFEYKTELRRIYSSYIRYRKMIRHRVDHFTAE